MIPLDSSVVVFSEHGREIRDSGRFEGYFPDDILLGYENIDFHYIKDIINVHSGYRLTKSELDTLFETNAIPIRGRLRFSSKEKNYNLTNSDFKNVTIMPHSAPGRWIGLAIGAAIDAGVITTLIVIALNNFRY